MKKYKVIQIRANPFDNIILEDSDIPLETHIITGNNYVVTFLRPQPMDTSKEDREMLQKVITEANER
jgi:hypothetical protein